jgi:putative transposase
VHWYRDVFSQGPSEKARAVAAMLKAIHAQEDRAAAEAKARDVVAKLRAAKPHNKAAEPVGQGVAEILSYHAFPEPHWRRIRTNDPLERIIREIRRRTRVVDAFPDGERALNLAAARLRQIAGTHRSTRRCLGMQPLHEAKLGDRLTGPATADTGKVRKILDTTAIVRLATG